MPYCSNCRTYIPDGVDTCPQCGTKDTRYSNVPPPTQTTSHSHSQSRGQSKFSQIKQTVITFIKKMLHTEDVTHQFDNNDIMKNTNNALLAYFGPFIIIPLLKARTSKFAMFHACQALMNMALGFLYFTVAPLILGLIPDILLILLILPYLFFLAIFPIGWVVGIINAYKGKAKTLPLSGRVDLMSVLFKNL